MLILAHDKKKSEMSVCAFSDFIAIHIYTSSISTCLSVGKVVMAEPLPQQPVLSEGPQLRTDLSQTDQVPAV